MKFFRLHRPDRISQIVLTLGGLFAGLALATLLSHGTAGGDEGGVLQFLATYRESGWHALAEGENNNFLAHRLFWLGEKLAWDTLIRSILPAALLSHPALYTYAMVIDDTLFILAAFALAVLHLHSTGHNRKIAFLAPAALMIASSGIGLFAGGFSECFMCLLVIIMMAEIDREKGISTGRFILLITVGICLIATKLYAAPFVLMLGLLLPGTVRQRQIFVAVFLVAPLAWLMVQTKIQSANSAGMVHFYISLMRGGDAAIASDAFAFFLSLSFGILPCFPLLLFASCCGSERRKRLAVKILAICGVAALLLPYRYWAGPGGLAGPRYIYPFLLIFLPEVAEGMRRVAVGPARTLLIAVPVAALLFLPCLEYRNSLVSRYALEKRAVSEVSWAHTDFWMHPAVFAWSVVAANFQSHKSIVLGQDLGGTAQVRDIFPMTTLSRVIYVLRLDLPVPAEVEAVKKMLNRAGAANVLAWEALRAILSALLIASLTLAAFPGRQSR